MDIARAGARVVFIYVTAGQLEASRQGVPEDVIWPARERGAMACVEALTGGCSQPPRTIDLCGHRITQYVCANTVSYFLRIREGIRRLRHGYEEVWPTVDGASAYTWRALVDTLRALVDYERGDADEHPCVNTHAGDPEINGPWGHEDHWAVGAAVEAAVLDGSYRLLGWIDYPVAEYEANLSEADAEQKRTLLRDAYSRVYEQDTGIDDWAQARETYEEWIPKSYIATPEGPAPSR
jgi:hypothetical protein